MGYNGRFLRQYHNVLNNSCYRIMLDCVHHSFWTKSWWSFSGHGHGPKTWRSCSALWHRRSKAHSHRTWRQEEEEKLVQGSFRIAQPRWQRPGSDWRYNVGDLHGGPFEFAEWHPQLSNRSSFILQDNTRASAGLRLEARSMGPRRWYTVCFHTLHTTWGRRSNTATSAQASQREYWSTTGLS